MLPSKTTNLLEYVQDQLNERKGIWSQISLSSGVPYSTIAHIAQGVTANPRVKTIQALLEYFHAKPIKTAKKAA
ncbi:hypothetical protein [Pseudomonas aeruginosa]|uniref:hypothetical protein n=1 Tax=Pseudomonas aeruginosa TaxID=287 RepID=UPI00387F1A56